MYLDEKAPHKKSRNIRRMILFVLLFLFFLSFWPEIVHVFTYIFGVIWAVGRVLFMGVNASPPPLDVKAFKVVGFNCIYGFGLIFIIWLLLISWQTLLPIKTFLELYRTAYHQILHIFGRHGQAVFVKDGKTIATKEELTRPGHGVVVVDYNSAVGLYESIPYPNPLVKLSTDLAVLLRLCDPRKSPRVCGPGVVFTRPFEKISASVDLRRQFRIQLHEGGLTRDGIPLKTHTWALFSVGLDPNLDFLQIVYDGNRRPKNLKVITFQKTKNNFVKVINIRSELDEEDQVNISQEQHKMREYIAPQGLNQTPEFDPERVAKAILATSLDSDKQPIPWDELPARVAASIFRENLSRMNYTNLFPDKEENPDHMQDLMEQQRLMMRNNGLLSYSLVMHADRQTLGIGKEYRISDLRSTPPQPVPDTNAKVLRKRGIKVISSGFTDLLPADHISSIIQNQYTQNWQIPLESERIIEEAITDHEANIIRGEARARAYEEFALTLSTFMDDSSLSREAKVLRLMQVMEDSLHDPNTKDELPKNVLRLVANLNLMFTDNPQSNQLKNGRRLEDE
ncbi:MAG: hypothetical protein JEZ06_01965 [Anaerolineaceae bacterium]|nr:hypothetical protein [Anaerolineaceae bacterium]